eukprot:898780-Prymnesium_polylepis.1
MASPPAAAVEVGLADEVGTSAAVFGALPAGGLVCSAFPRGVPALEGRASFGILVGDAVLPDAAALCLASLACIGGLATDALCVPFATDALSCALPAPASSRVVDVVLEAAARGVARPAAAASSRAAAVVREPAALSV